MRSVSKAMRCSFRRRRRESAYPGLPKVSILVPAYNTPKSFLEALLKSVLDQTSANWELCLADASTDDSVGSVVRPLAEKDARIRYRRLEKNLGISCNTNEALKMATGEVIALLDHDDLLHPSAVYAVAHAVADEKADFVYTDEVIFDSETGRLANYAYKPDFDPFYLLGANYICHFSAFRRELLKCAGGAFRPEFDGSQDHDLILRLTERATKVVHVREALYFWRAHGGSVARALSAKQYAVDAGIRAVREALERRGLSAKVESARPSALTLYRIRYDLTEKARVSIVIPTRNHVEDLRLCLESVFRQTTYPDYEIIVVDNGSDDPGACRYLAEIGARQNVKVVRHDAPFNFSHLVNLGARQASGKYLLLLNNDTEVLVPNWLEELVSYARLPEVGAVGAKLYYPDGTVQHAGVIIGIGGVADHAFRDCAHDDPGVGGRMLIAHEYSAVTAACLMVRRDVFDEIGGFDPQLAVTFNDVDFCMRLCKAGYHNVWTPFAELLHYESKSRGSDQTPDRIARFRSEIRFFRQRWAGELKAGDPFYHPQFSLVGDSFRVRNWYDRVLRPPHARSGWHKKLPLPLSKAIGGIFCLQDNGWKYTCKHTAEKLRRHLGKPKID